MPRGPRRKDKSSPELSPQDATGLQSSPRWPENGEGTTTILTNGFNDQSRGRDEPTTMGNKTRRRQLACAAPGVDMVELVVKNKCGEARPRRGGSFYRWGNDEPRGRGGLMVAASGGELF
jgi:hypothetical protein